VRRKIASAPSSKFSYKASFFDLFARGSGVISVDEWATTRIDRLLPKAPKLLQFPALMKIAAGLQKSAFTRIWHPIPASIIP
jgi:hypothetical protein